MQVLVDGVHRFQKNAFLSMRDLYSNLANVQRPHTLFITCSDSRIDPGLLTQSRPGDLFVLRNSGNIVPPFGALAGGEAATIEFAVVALKVHQIVVCGHSPCAAMEGLVRPESVKDMPAVRLWLDAAESTRQILKANYHHAESTSERISAAIAENVLVQLENLRTHPSVAAALGRGDLALQGWIYHIETGEVFACDPNYVRDSPSDLAGSPTPARERFKPI